MALRPDGVGQSHLWDSFAMGEGCGKKLRHGDRTKIQESLVWELPQGGTGQLCIDEFYFMICVKLYDYSAACIHAE